MIEVHYNGMTPGGWHRYSAFVDGYLLTLRTDTKSMAEARAYFKAEADKHIKEMR